MPENAKNEEATPATEAQQEAIQASDELSENDLEGVAGGVDPRIDARVPNIPID